MESPDTIQGRMKEGAHLAGYSLQRSMENLRWLLEESRYEQLTAGYHNVNDFLRDIQEAFVLLNIKPEERKQIAELVKELQPKASQRAIADMMGVNQATIAADLGTIERGRSNDEYSSNNSQKQPYFDEYSPPAIPADDFNAIELERKKRKREERKQDIQDERKKLIEDREISGLKFDGVSLILGDMNIVGKNLQDNSIDLILTDPPYPGEFISCWDSLAELAVKVLKPSGFLIAYSGQLHIPEVLQKLNIQGIQYYWTMCLIHNGGNQFIHPRNVSCGWKPLFIFQKEPFKRNSFYDVIQGSGREKELHDWAQATGELDYIIDKFTIEGDLILDPFAGSGTTLLAAKKNNRRSIGIEIDEVNYKIALSRLEDELS